MANKVRVIYIKTRVEVLTDEDADMQDIVNEMDYDYKSTTDGAKVIDMELVHFNEVDPNEES
jgi:hypothetical protein